MEDRLTSVNQPGGRTETIGYDGAGRINSRSVPSVHSATFTHEPSGRQISASFSGSMMSGSVTTSYTTLGYLKTSNEQQTLPTDTRTETYTMAADGNDRDEDDGAVATARASRAGRCRGEP